MRVDTTTLLYVLIVVHHGTRELISAAVTRHPSAEWLANRMTEAFPWDGAPRSLIRDNDGAYGEVFKRRLRAMGIRDPETHNLSPHSPFHSESSFGRKD